MPQIRHLTPTDHAAALRLYTELTAPKLVSTDPAHFNTLLAHPGTTIWGADLNSAICAMVTLHLLPNMTYAGRPYGLIENVVTAEAHRGLGLGRAVMQALAAHAWQQGAYKLMLLTGTARGAVGFYRALGFDADAKQGMILRAHPSNS